MAAATIEKIRSYYNEVTDPQILTFLYYKMAEQILKTKTTVSEGTGCLFDQCIYDIIDRSIAS